MYYDKIVAAMNPTNMTPYIIEERQLNISQLDVFQINDGQIIFLGTGIDDKLQISFKHNCCSLKAQMRLRIFKFT
jgi:hypothetical protein